MVVTFLPGVESSRQARRSVKSYVHLASQVVSLLTGVLKLLQYATERLGRKIALMIIWVTLVAVSIQPVNNKCLESRERTYADAQSARVSSLKRLLRGGITGW